MGSHKISEPDTSEEQESLDPRPSVWIRALRDKASDLGSASGLLGGLGQVNTLPSYTWFAPSVYEFFRAGLASHSGSVQPLAE